jgi:CheY-like chemotaxis protein
MKILLVDDDADDRFLFQESIQLIDRSITCTTAGNEEEALEVLTKEGEKPDLIFLDINMPVMNGIACLKAIRSNQELKHLDVVIVSTSILREDEKFFQTDGTGYMEKPNDYDKLERELGVHIMAARQKLVMTTEL